MISKISAGRALLFVTVGVVLFIWGYGDNSAGVAAARGGDLVIGTDAHAIGILKMIGGVAFVFLAVCLYSASRKS